MGVETFVSLRNELAIEPLLAPPDLSPPQSRMAARCGSNAKANRQTPLVASKRSSFMFLCREPFSVSTRGRPRCGPKVSRTAMWASSSSWTGSGRASYSGTNAACRSTLHDGTTDYGTEDICISIHIGRCRPDAPIDQHSCLGGADRRQPLARRRKKANAPTTGHVTIQLRSSSCGRFAGLGATSLHGVGGRL